MRKEMFRRRNEKMKKGFTLLELLIASLIMAIVFLLVVAGTASSSNAYKNFAQRSEAEVLMTENISLISNILRNARFVNGVKEQDGNLVFESGVDGFSGYLENRSNGIYMTALAGVSRPLTTEKSRSEDMKVQLDALSYDETNHRFDVTLGIYDKAAGTQLKSQFFTVIPTEYIIRTKG